MSSLKREHERSRVRRLVNRYARGSVRSTQEVRADLERRGVSSTVAARVIAECQTLRILDDEAGARLWADQWARCGYAWTAIHAKLSLRGFSDETIERAAKRLGTAGDDDARARLVVAASLRRHRTRPATRWSLARTLASRGFDADLIERVLNESSGPAADGSSSSVIL